MMTCTYRFVFPCGRVEVGQRSGTPEMIEAAARLSGAIGVTVMVLS